MRRIDLTGNTYNQWTVLYFSKTTNNRSYWWCRCSCGLEKEVCGADLVRNRSKSCGHDKKVDLSGSQIGEWTVLEKSRMTDAYVVFYLCQCSCGVVKEVRHSNLISGSTNCGHDNRKHPDIQAGMVFGDWEVLEKDNGSRHNSAKWLCRCSCGRERYVYGSSLLSGRTLECGHSQSDGIEKGMRFGQLEVLEFHGRNRQGNSIWICKCDCGKVKNISGVSLKDGTISCGCYAAEQASIRASERLKQNNGHFVRNHNWYIRCGDETISCKSSYEVFVWNYFYYVLGTSIQYEPETFKINGSTRYTPDFYLPEENAWLETKGSLGFSDQTEKINYLRNNKGMDIRVLFWEDIRSMCGLKYKTLKSYGDNAERLGISIEEYLGDGIYLRG